MRDPVLVRDVETLERADVNPRRAPRMPRPRRVLLADPASYDIRYAINPHMRTAAGELQTVDKAAARRQWATLRDAYMDIGLKVATLEADDELPDLVFTANPAFPYLDPHAGAEDVGSGRGCAYIPGRMANRERRGEVAPVSRHLDDAGYRQTPLPRELEGPFEGNGDLLWVGDRRLLLGGIGPRTGAGSLRAAADIMEIPIVALEMIDPDLYHLDTCLSVLDDRRALWVPNAFTEHAKRLLSRIFEELIPVDDLEARRLLACNAHCPDGRRVLIQAGSSKTVQAIEEAGLEAIELDTSEFLRAGGSVFCMKLMYW